MSTPKPSNLPSTWYEADHVRLVAEIQGVQSKFPGFEWSLVEGNLTATGSVEATLPGDEPQTLTVRLTYPAGFPVRPIMVLPLSPEIPAERWGHTWHRWSNGTLCLGDPDLWDISYSGADVIEKSQEWYFNYLAKVSGRVAEMPDIGPAAIFESDAPSTTFQQMYEEEMSC